MLIVSRYTDEKAKIQNYRREINIKKYPKTLTKQSMAEELDVNNIVKKYTRPELKDMAEKFEGIYGDFDHMDYAEALTKISAAEELFMEVPSQIRARFNNDPGEWIHFATDPENIEELRKLGLAKPTPPDVEPQEVKIVNPEDLQQQSA